MPESATGEVPRARAAQFANTRWSLILVSRQHDKPGSREALEKLCALYWYPLYAFVRRKGYDHHQAEDLTQAFFERLLEKHFLAEVKPEAGRFRSFLLAALNHFLANEWDKTQAEKRGGGKTLVSFDSEPLETRYRLEPVDHTTPETLYERRWAMTILDQALAQLQREYTADGNGGLFEALKNCLSGGNAPVSRAEIAGQLHINVNSLDTAIHRLRQRYRVALRKQIAPTVNSTEEIDEEVRYLRQIVSDFL